MSACIKTSQRIAILEASGGINIETYESIDELAEAAMYKAWARNNFNEETLKRFQAKINEMLAEQLNAGSLT